MAVLTLAHHPHGRSLDLVAYEEVSVQGPRFCLSDGS